VRPEVQEEVHQPGHEDVRGFYAALGIELSAWSVRNATVRCFADPEAHAHQDRNPSCSVSLEHGAWRCWACGAKGSAYRAALVRGHSPASAFDLLVGYGLAERRPYQSLSLRMASPGTGAAAARRGHELSITEIDVQRWHEALFETSSQRWRKLLAHQRLWEPAVIRELGIGHDGERVTIPIRDARGVLQGVLRYRPGAGRRKMLAIRGSRLGLVPHPSREPSDRVLLVEGPPDMIAARSQGWRAIAVPGDHAWQPRWAELFTGRSVTVLMDSDRAGREAAHRIATDLRPVAEVRVVDLAPDRDDGFDLTNWLREQPQPRSKRCRPSSSPRPTIKR
jgi:hypothetical protein